MIPELTPNSPLLDFIRWDAVRNLFKRAWFGLIWVLQEVGLAESPVAFIGNVSMKFGKLMQACYLIPKGHGLDSNLNIRTGALGNAIDWI
jgi:hypothetical protein